MHDVPRKECTKVRLELESMRRRKETILIGARRENESLDKRKKLNCI